MNIGDSVAPADNPTERGVVNGIQVMFASGMTNIFTGVHDLIPWVPAPVVPTFYCALDGSDSTGDGSHGRPWRTVTKLAIHTPSGGMGLIEGGTYIENSVVVLANSKVVLKPVDSSKTVTIMGRVWVKNTAYSLSIFDLIINGSKRPTTESQPTFMCNAVDFTATRVGVTNGNTHIGWSMGGTTYGRADRFLLDHCWGDYCGALTANGRLHDHGIYIEHATQGKISGGHFNNNASRGVQLYPDAQFCIVDGVEGTGNRQGLLFGGGSEDYGPQGSCHNTVSGSSFHGNTDADIDSWNGSTAKMIDNLVEGTYAPHLADQSGYVVQNPLPTPPVLA